VEMQCIFCEININFWILWLMTYYSYKLLAGQLGFDIWQRQDFSLLHSVQTISGDHPAYYPIGTRSSFPGLKWQGHNTHHSPPASAKVKNGGLIHLLHHTSSRRGVYLIKPRDKFIFYVKELHASKGLKMLGICKEGRVLSTLCSCSYIQICMSYKILCTKYIFYLWA
jgi:hypothetical protein